jgi:hypothetical protein
MIKSGLLSNSVVRNGRDDDEFAAAGVAGRRSQSPYSRSSRNPSRASAQVISPVPHPRSRIDVTPSSAASPA